MPRSTRTHAPGVAFHVIGVTHRHEPWFNDDIKTQICADIDAAGAAAGHRILARLAMSNHFHIVLKQSSSPLAWMMQRVMQRASMRVKQTHGIEGHVFCGRYWAQPVPTPKYVRRAIAYTHLNPCAANICDEPDGYAWSSHHNYLAAASCAQAEDIGFRDGLMMFADDSADLSDVVANYLRFIDFCQVRRRDGIVGDWLLPGSTWFPDAPIAPLGDEHWAKTFTHFNGHVELPRKTIDARNVAITLLRRIDPKVDLDTIRFGGKTPKLSNVRRQLVCAMSTAGCRPCAISRLLNISPALVSAIRTRMFLSDATEQ